MQWWQLPLTPSVNCLKPLHWKWSAPIVAVVPCSQKCLFLTQLLGDVGDVQPCQEGGQGLGNNSHQWHPPVRGLGFIFPKSNTCFHHLSLMDSHCWACSSDWGGMRAHTWGCTNGVHGKWDTVMLSVEMVGVNQMMLLYTHLQKDSAWNATGGKKSTTAIPATEYIKIGPSPLINWHLTWDCIDWHLQVTRCLEEEVNFYLLFIQTKI